MNSFCQKVDSSLDFKELNKISSYLYFSKFLKTIQVILVKFLFLGKVDRHLVSDPYSIAVSQPAVYFQNVINRDVGAVSVLGRAALRQ